MTALQQSCGIDLIRFVGLVIATDDPRRDDVRELIEVHLGFSRGATPIEFSFALGMESLLDQAVTLFSAREDGVLIAIGALKEIDARHAELKPMHTSADARRRGVGRAMVEHLLAVAQDRGYERVSLETGTTEDFAPARALYASMGFEPSRPFNGYRASPHNTFMTIRLEL